MKMSNMALAQADLMNRRMFMLLLLLLWTTTVARIQTPVERLGRSAGPSPSVPDVYVADCFPSENKLTRPCLDH
jgi:hypothetical protein